VCCINSDEATAKVPESVHLEGSLDAEDKNILMQCGAWGREIYLIFIKDLRIF
jgi:hypothetical protein